MARTLSALDDLHYDANATVVEWTEAADDFLELSLMEKIAQVIAYHDENGLRPTNDALTVIARVLAAIDEVDEAYDTPMYCRYTENVRVMLRTGGRS
jgi:hypothetical protein